MLFVLFGPVLLIAWACVRAFRHRHRSFAAPAVSTQLSSAADLHAAVVPLMKSWGYRPDNQGEAGTVFCKCYRPAWLIVPCVLFFPFGLLSLLYSRTVDVSFGLGAGEVIVSGTAPQRLQQEIVERLSAGPR